MVAVPLVTAVRTSFALTLIMLVALEVIDEQKYVTTVYLR